MTVIGIRREARTAERRAPLVPDDVAALAREHGLRFVVQTSEHRVFGDGEFRAAGAEVSADLGAARVIFGIKEVPPERLAPGRTYVFFGHVIKGQEHNMPLLARLLGVGATLIDYERIADADGRRLIGFSHEAGQAGMIDALHLLGRRLDLEGAPTPLARVRPAWEYRDLEDSRSALAEVGRRLGRGYETGDGPLVVGFTGDGRVSRGAQEIFDLLPHEEADPEELGEIAARSGETCDRLFKVRLASEHLVQPREPGGAFDENDYFRHPERYRGGRLVRYLPHVTLLVHGVFWTADYPRFLTRREAAAMWKAGGRKLRLVADVTCDVGGSIELTYRATSRDSPTYVYDPLTGGWRDGLEGPGIAVLAVDNLPSELPLDASRNFSRVLRDYVPAIAAADYDRPFEELALPPEIKGAVVTHRGALTPEYRYLRDALEAIAL